MSDITDKIDIIEAETAEGANTKERVGEVLRLIDSKADSRIPLPTEGTSGQVLTTDGAGVYTWENGDFILDADADGQLYGRRDNAWEAIDEGGGGGDYSDWANYSFDIDGYLDLNVGATNTYLNILEEDQLFIFNGGSTQFNGSVSILSGSLSIGTYYLPETDGTIGQVLTTDGYGMVTWENVATDQGYTVSTLPTGSIGDTAYVTDATAPTYLGTLTGGGSVTCPVWHNGTIWVSR